MTGKIRISTAPFLLVVLAALVVLDVGGELAGSGIRKRCQVMKRVRYLFLVPPRFPTPFPLWKKQHLTLPPLWKKLFLKPFPRVIRSFRSLSAINWGPLSGRIDGLKELVFHPNYC